MYIYMCVNMSVFIRGNQSRNVSSQVNTWTIGSGSRGETATAVATAEQMTGTASSEFTRWVPTSHWHALVKLSANKLFCPRLLVYVQWNSQFRNWFFFRRGQAKGKNFEKKPLLSMFQPKCKVSEFSLFFAPRNLVFFWTSRCSRRPLWWWCSLECHSSTTSWILQWPLRLGMGPGISRAACST